jgi:hypothetical protein
MFSNVGMNPYGPGGGIVTQQAQTATLPQSDSRSAVRGESGAAAAKAETAERLDPARQSVPAAPLPDAPQAPRSAEFGTRFVPMVTPEQARVAVDRSADPTDARAPAGPPPAFRRSLLEARMAETSAPDPAPAIISAPEPPEAATATAPAAAVDQLRAQAAPGAMDPSAPPETRSLPAVAAKAPELAEDETQSSVRAKRDEDADPLRAAIRRLLDDGDPAPVPPSAEKRAEAEFAGLRRMEVPYDTGTVDLSR